MTTTLDRPVDSLPLFDEATYDEARHGVFHEQDRSGDTRHMWDKGNDVEVKAARKLFDELKKKGHLIYAAVGKEGTKGELMREFDPTAERIIATPQLQGG